jgi:L-ascorbate metabolism protein UlaG (beta-lactamase superfamily)
LLCDLKMRIGDINILLLPIDNPEMEKIETGRLIRIIDTFCPNIVIPMHYFSLSHKIEFLNDLYQSGYEILDNENNFIEILLDSELLAKRKEILNIKAGKYESIKTI